MVRESVKELGVVVAPVAFVAQLSPPAEKTSPFGGLIEEQLREGQEHLPAPTVLSGDNPRDSSFLANEYVGSIRFGGGFIRTGETALEVRARLVEFSAQEELTVQGRGWLGDSVNALLVAAKIPARPLAGDAFVPPAPERRPVRGMNVDDGHDNLNLPRTTLVPGAWTAGQNAGGRWVLVPYLRNYYIHNGGWFLGQEYGCTAGARVEVMLVLYDTQTGVPAWWQIATGRHIQEMIGQPSAAEEDQYLLWAEGWVEGEFKRGFLR